MTTIPDYVTPEYLAGMHLRRGRGTGKPGDRCAIQEVRAWLGLDASEDTVPDCVCPVIGEFVIHAQDSRKDWRAAMPPLLPKLIGSRGSDALTKARAYRCADWAVRTVAPAALDSAADALVTSGDTANAKVLRDHAAKLRGLAPIDSADAAKNAAKSAESAARSAEKSAADSASWNAAGASWNAAGAADSSVEGAAEGAASAARSGATTDPIAFIHELLAMVEP